MNSTISFWVCMFIVWLEITVYLYNFNFFVGSVILLLMIGIGLFSHKYNKEKI